MLWVARDRVISHSLGVFTATFLYTLAALGGVARSGGETVPFISALWSSAFDQICFYGATSVQVMRRMNALVADLTQAVPEERHATLEHWDRRLKTTITRSFADGEQRQTPREKTCKDSVYPAKNPRRSGAPISEKIAGRLPARHLGKSLVADVRTASLLFARHEGVPCRVLVKRN